MSEQQEAATRIQAVHRGKVARGELEAAQAADAAVAEAAKAEQPQQAAQQVQAEKDAAREQQVARVGSESSFSSDSSSDFSLDLSSESDSGGSGAAEELTAGLNAELEPASDDEVARYFHQMDSDNSSSLDRDEVCELLTLLKAEATEAADDDREWLIPTPEELDAAMLTMDLDGNGTVSLAEFREWWDGKGGWSYAEDPTQWEP